MVQNGWPFVNLPKCDIAIPCNSSSLNDTGCSVRWMQRNTGGNWKKNEIRLRQGI